MQTAGGDIVDAVEQRSQEGLREERKKLVEGRPESRRKKRKNRRNSVLGRERGYLKSPHTYQIARSTLHIGGGTVPRKGGSHWNPSRGELTIPVAIIGSKLGGGEV